MSRTQKHLFIKTCIKKHCTRPVNKSVHLPAFEKSVKILILQLEHYCTEGIILFRVEYQFASKVVNKIIQSVILKVVKQSTKSKLSHLQAVLSWATPQGVCIKK